MRLGTYPLLSLSCVLGAALFAACGTDVSEPGDTSSTGSGGAGATTTSAGGAGGTGPAGPTTTTTTTAATTSATTGSGGGGICDQACDKIANECGIPGACGLIGVDCSGTDFDCFGQCVLDATCDQILSLAGGTPDPEISACVNGCQGGTGGAGGGGAGGGGSGNDCGGCVAQECAGDVGTCFQDPTCQPFLQCAQDCVDQPCVEACLEQYPGAQPLVDCTCASCADACAACGNAGSGGAGGMAP